MNQKVHCRSLSSIHILYNHSPTARLRPHPELCCGFDIFNWTEVVRDRLLCCTGPKHGSRLVRSGGAARTKRSRRPPRWKHARRGCLADSDPAGDGRRQYVGGPDAPHSLAAPDAHAQAIGMREARRTVPSLPSERHRIPMHTTARRADSSRRRSPSR